MNARFQNYIEALTPKKRDLVCEAVKEYLQGEADEVELMCNAQAVFKKCRWLSMESEEHAMIVLCNKRYGFIKSVVLSNGCQDCTFFDVRKVIRDALMCNALSVIMVHNHPSGNTSPSRDDDKITEAIKKACELMRIRLADHVIIAGGNYYSYAENGKI